MKKIFDAAMVLGILIIIGGAGGYETASAGFVKSLVIMLFGVIVMVAGAYGKEKYQRYVRRGMMMHRRGKTSVNIKREDVQKRLELV